MNTKINNDSVTKILQYSLTTNDRYYVENHYLNHKVLLESLENGVSGAILRSVVTHIPKTVVADAIKINVNNLGRLSKKNLNKYQSDVLIDLSNLWYELRQFFNFDADSVREWISTPLPALAGVSPGLLMNSIAGRNELRSLLKSMRSGDFC